MDGLDEVRALDELDDPVQRLFLAILIRAGRDALGQTTPIYPGANLVKVRQEAYDWIMGDDAIQYAIYVGLPVEWFKRNRRNIPDPRKEGR